jgi:hypothetical protein
MENCVYKDEIIFALEVKTGFNKEQEIRLAGAKDLLTCVCCGKNVIYKRGEIIDAHFAHKDASSDCVLESKSGFTKPSKTKIYVLNLLQDYFSQNYQVRKYVRLINNHFSDLVIENDKNKLVIEVEDKRMSAINLDNLKSKYQENNINVNWIVLDKVSPIVSEENTYYIKRAFLNETGINSIIVIDKNIFKFAAYYLDKTEYRYHESPVRYVFRNNIIYYPFNINKLKIIDNKLVVEGFNELVSKWLKERRNECYLYEYETVNDIEMWTLDNLLNSVNEIVNGKEYLIDVIGYCLTKIYKSKAFQEFVDMYNQLKLISSNNEQYKYLVEVMKKIFKSANQILNNQ